MSEIDNDYKKVKSTAKTIVVTFLIIFIFRFWWEWCMEKPIRFLYTVLIIGGLIFFSHTQSYEYQHPDCVICQ